MNIDVGKAIKELLFEHPAVIIPGLGGFTSAASTATVDYVQGVVTPPTKKLEFNANLVINDGMLVGHIQQSDMVTAEQAKEAIDLFVSETKAALERREIVDLPAVGRLYKDYERKIRFMAEGSNFESNSFGLPNVQFQPIIRERPATASPAAASTAQPNTVANQPGVPPSANQAPPVTTAPPSGAQKTDWMAKLWPALIVLAAILLAFCIFFFFSGDDQGPTAGDDMNQERLNVKPKADDATLEAPTGQANGNPSASEGNLNQPSEDNPASAPTTSAPEAQTPAPPTTASGMQSSFIVVHTLGNRANLNKFERKLTGDGYTPYKKKLGDMYRIGILFDYRDQGELDAKVKELADKYGSSPKIVDPE